MHMPKNPYKIALMKLGTFKVLGDESKLRLQSSSINRLIPDSISNVRNSSIMYHFSHLFSLLDLIGIFVLVDFLLLAVFRFKRLVSYSKKYQILDLSSKPLFFYKNNNWGGGAGVWLLGLNINSILQVCLKPIRPLR